MSDDIDRSVAGDPGTRRDVRNLPRISPSSLKGAAQLKVVDFRLLSAAFSGQEVAFEPWLSLRLMESDRIVSWAAYQPASSDDREGQLPDVAWRRAEWDKFRDIDRFRAAPDKAAYLRGNGQIDSRIRFGRLAELPRLAEAIREGVEVMVGGVVVHAAERPEMIWQRLHVAVADERAVMNLDYAPWATRCGEVESWAHRWSTFMDSMGDERITVPDSDITVRYEDSFEDLVARTYRFPQASADYWLTPKR